MTITFGSIALATRQNVTVIAGKENPLNIRQVAKPKKKSDEGLLSSTGNFLNGILGNVLNLVNNISWQSVAAWIVGFKQFIFNFNWQISDDELNAAIAQAEITWYGQLGELLGTSAGWVLCGVVPGAAIGIINEAAMMHVLSEVGEEAFDEISDQLMDLARLTGQQLMNKYFSKIYMGARALIKRAANGESDTLLGGGIEVLLKFCPKSWTEAIKTWGDKGQKPWSIASGIQDFIETLPEGKVQEFAEEFVDALGESCGQAIFAIGRGLDAYVLEQKMAKEMQQGKERYITVQLDRNDPKSTITLLGTEQEVETQIFTAHANYKMMEGRDVGQWVGEPVREWLKSPPISIQMRILLSDKEKTLTGAKRKQITIPNVDRAKIDWAEIKTALGGSNGYFWGRFRGKAVLNTGHFLDVYANSEQSAIALLESLITFSHSEIETCTVTEEQKIGARKKYDALYKKDTRIYPIKFTIINQVKVLNEESGIVQPSGIYNRKNSGWIDLTGDTKPDDFEETLTELFKTPGPNG